MQTHNVDIKHLFNADQTGNNYRRFPCTTICKKEKVDETKGTKAAKDKDRLTSMVCTSSEGKKCPLAYVGKAARPHCFADISEDLKKHYTSNKTA